MTLTIWKALLGAGGMMALILDGETALRGASAGLALCIRTVIPSLFPFVFLCTLLTNALWGSSLTWLRPLTAPLGIPSGAEALLLSALLGGYPTGARQIGQACREGKLARADAEHLLTFCSNAGPAFLFGITAVQFGSAKTVWVLWLIHILSALLTGRLLCPGGTGTASLSGRDSSIDQILTASVRTMGIICGWIVLFQILLAFLDRWLFWVLSPTLQVTVTGLLELSSGCCRLMEIGDPGLRLLVCTLMVSFGGLCVAMQTGAVVEGLPLGPYLRGKLIQTGISLALAGLYLRLSWPVFWCGLLLVPPAKKRSGFFRLSGV